MYCLKLVNYCAYIVCYPLSTYNNAPSSRVNNCTAADMLTSDDLKNFVRYLLLAVLIDSGINRGSEKETEQ